MLKLSVTVFENKIVEESTKKNSEEEFKISTGFILDFVKRTTRVKNGAHFFPQNPLVI